MLVNVYMDDGRVYQYEVSSQSKAREHCQAIAMSGYRHIEPDGTFEHYGPHRITKIKVTGGAFKPDHYPETAIGTE